MSLTVIFCSPGSRLDFEQITKPHIKLIDIWGFVSSLTVRFHAGTVEIKSPLLPTDELIAAKSIIYHPDSWELLEFVPLEGDSEFQFARRQLLSVLRFTEAYLSTLHTVLNNISTSRYFSNKPNQLSHLTRHFPDALVETTITSDPKLLTVGNIIKHVSESRQLDGGLSNFAQILDDDALEVLQSNKALPLTSQFAIKADMEYRAYLFNEQNLVIRFRQGGGDAHHMDIHTDLDKLLHPEHVELPQNYLDLLQAIRKSIGLTYCAIDFFIVDEGLKVLEANTLPSWAWLPAPSKRRVEEMLLQII